MCCPGLVVLGCCELVIYAMAVFYPPNFSSTTGAGKAYTPAASAVPRRQNLKFRVNWHITLAPSTSTRRSFAPDAA